MSESNEAALPESAIAIVGMAGRFPGARDPEAFWRNLREGRESIRRYSPDELRAAGVAEASLADANYVPAGAPLEDMEHFDAGFFGFSPLDASILDPQHRHFLECCWEALESAGHDPARFPGGIGVFAGSGHNAYLPYNLLSNPELVAQVGLFLLRHTGNDKDFLATRASYCLDLRGPSVNVQTACSTSLVAVHLASQSLLGGECDLALAGGVTVELPHRQGYAYEEGEILSPDGHCRPFDARSAGTVFGSGVGLVALRRLEDAMADGDTVLAVIRGSAINNDGAGKVGYLAPSVDGQAEAVAEALSVAGVDPATVSYIETHGTGTPVGDPIEIAALRQAYGARPAGAEPCAIGSVKSNIGHLDTAAGVASLIKVVQALRHAELPPSLNFEAPNLACGLEDSPFVVNAGLRPWAAPAGQLRRAGVSSLGVGGTNAHLILEEAPLPETAAAGAEGWQVLPFSARSPGAVQAVADRLAEHLRAHPELSVADVAATLQSGRRAFGERRAVVCRGRDEAVAALESDDPREMAAGTAPATARSVAFLLPGGGAAYPGMGRGLYESEAVYRQQLDAGLDLLDSELREAVRALLFPAAGQEASAAERLERPSLQLPALFLTQMALAKLWMAWGVEPAALIGHSLGENTAACLAGVFRFEDALALVCLRGRLFERVPPGGMLSVPLAPDELAPLLGDDLSLAAVNGPDLCVASGGGVALEGLEARLAERGVESQRVRIAVAAHSAMLEPILDEWSSFLESLQLEAPRIPFLSNLTGGWIRAEEATDPDYWVRHLRGRVRFAEGVDALLEEPERVLLEVGPGRSLGSLARLSPRLGSGHSVESSLRHPDEVASDAGFLRRALGGLWVAGVDLDWSAARGGADLRRVPLPTYPWEHQRHWIEAGRPAVAAAPEREAADARLPEIADWFSAPVWKPAPRPHGLAPIAPSGVLIFADSEGIGERVAAGLRAEGSRVVLVRRGSRFARPGDDDFELRESAGEDYAALLERLGADPTGVPAEWLHLWNVGAPPPQGLDGLEAGAESAFFGPLELGRALVDGDLETELSLRFVSSDMQQVAGEPLAAPLRALLLGPCRVLPRELPGLRCQSLDIDLAAARVRGDAGLDRLAELLRAELGQTEAPSEPASEPVVALRGGERLRLDFERVAVAAPPTPHPRLREGGVYLITGGLGGLGLALAEWLAHSRRARLVLLGRRGLPPRESWSSWIANHGESDPQSRCLRRIEAMEAAGAEVMLCAADVSERASLADAVSAARERFGTIHGVFHAAGCLDDQLVALKTRESAERVLAPKLRGTLTLEAVLGDDELDFLVLYSSVSALTGLPGQVDYTAANAFLDAFARHHARQSGRFTLSLNWSAWREVGMAAELAGRGDEPPLARPAHPLLDTCLERDDRSTVFRSELSNERWILDEHRLASGVPLLPGTAYVELARAALESEPQDRVVEIRDALFLAPCIVPEGETREIRVELERQGSSQEFLVCSVVDPDRPEAVIEHARGEIAYVDAHAPPARSMEELRAACAGRSVDEPEPAPHLRFGARWHNVQRIQYGEAEALLALELPADYAADLEGYGLHPALLDIATAGAQRLIQGNAEGEAFYVPVGYGRLRAWAALGSRVFSHVRYRGVPDGAADDFASFDVTLLDVGGRTLVEIEGFLMKRLEPDAELSVAPVLRRRSESSAARPATGNPLLDSLDQALATEEGLAVLERALALEGTSQLAISTLDLQAWIARVTAPPAGPGREPAHELELSAELLEGLGEIESALAGHEAVREAAAMAFEDRPGQRRLVAYVVHDPEHDATGSELRRFLRKSLSESWVPASFVDLEELPRDASGALDRRALEDPFGLADDHVAPRSETEQVIAGVWGEVLGVEAIGVHDNFFDIGGHSLLSMRAIARIDKRIGVKLDNAIMLLHTLEQIAAECDERLGRQGSAAAEPAGEGEAEQAPEREGLARKLFRSVRGRGA